MKSIQGGFFVLFIVLTAVEPIMASISVSNNCINFYGASSFSFSSKDIESVPLSPALIKEIYERSQAEKIDMDSPDHIKLVESWGMLLNKRASVKVYELMRDWSPAEPHTIDVIVYKSRLQELRSKEGEHFSGTSADISRLLSGRKLEHTEIQEFPDFYRVGVLVKTLDNLEMLQGVLKFGTIQPYGISRNTQISRNSIMPLPQSEVAALAKKWNKDDLDTSVWGWFNKSTEGRVSYAAAEKIASWDGKEKLKFHLFVLKPQLDVLRQKEPNVFKGDSSDLTRLLVGRKLKSTIVSDSAGDIKYEVTIESAEQLEKLDSLISFAVVHPYLILAD